MPIPDYQSQMRLVSQLFPDTSKYRAQLADILCWELAGSHVDSHQRIANCEVISWLK